MKKKKKMKLTIRDKIDKIVNIETVKLNNKIGRQLGKLLNAESIIITRDYEWNLINVIINGYKVKGIEIDEYNNVIIDRIDYMPIECLKILRILFNEYLENKDSYYHRTGTGLFIEYFEKHYKRLSLKYIREMCKIDSIDNEGKGEGFRDWLVGDSYSEGGNIRDYLPKFGKFLFLDESY